MLLRPDSGDIVEVVIQALEAAEKVFGAPKNSKGFKVPRECGVVQGDGVDLESMNNILEAVMAKGFSAQVLVSPRLPLVLNSDRTSQWSH